LLFIIHKEYTAPEFPVPIYRKRKIALSLMDKNGTRNYGALLMTSSL